MRGGGETGVKEDGVGFGGVQLAPGLVGESEGREGWRVGQGEGGGVVVGLIGRGGRGLGEMKGRRGRAGR